MDNADDAFRWPDAPPYPVQDWFRVTGTELGLEPDQIRFAAALITLGGPDSRNNTIAARLAGRPDLSRTQAFRWARSVKVRKLIDDAEQIKTGKRKPLTEEQIDERIDKMISSPNDLAAAKGIELREKRTERRHQREMEARNSCDINQELREISAISVELAIAYAASRGVAFPPPEIPTANNTGNGLDKDEAANVAAE
jgi:hypothetical protein